MDDDDFPAVLMRAIQQGKPERERKRPKLPMKEAQADVLDDLMTSLRKPRKFSPGEAVHYPGGYGPLNKEAREGLEHRFFRYLDLSTYEDQHRMDSADGIELATLPKIDCLVVNFDGTTVRFSLASSLVLRPGSLPESGDD